MPGPLYAVQMLPLADGRVLVLGESTAVLRTFLYDPAQQTWTEPLFPGSAVLGQRTSLLHDGRVLMVGGADAGGTEVSSAYLFDPATGEWTASPAFPIPISNHSMTVLANGNVLVAGGISLGFREQSAFRFDPIAGEWTPLPDMAEIRSATESALLSDGRVLVAGGEQGNGAMPLAADLFDPALDAWSPTGNLNQPRWDHSLSALEGGGAVILGGIDDVYSWLDHTEMLDSTTQLFSAMPPMAYARRRLSTARLADGRVWIIGGYEQDTSEVFDPSGPTFTASEPLPERRGMHGVTLLADGRFLVAGGTNTTSGDLSSTLISEPDPTAITTSVRTSCAAAFPGARIPWQGQGLPGAGGASLSMPVPPDVNGIVLLAAENQLLHYPEWTQPAPGSGALTIPPGLLSGWYRLHAVVRGSYGGGQMLRVGRAPGSSCRASSECGGGACANGMCSENPCTLAPVDPSEPVDPPAPVDPLDPGPPGDLLSLRVGCGCTQSGGSPAVLAAVFLVLRSLRRARG